MVVQNSSGTPLGVVTILCFPSFLVCFHTSNSCQKDVGVPEGLLLLGLLRQALASHGQSSSWTTASLRPSCPNIAHVGWVRNLPVCTALASWKYVRAQALVSSPSS